MPGGGRRTRNIYEVAAEFRARLLRGEGEAAREMARAYAEAWGRVRGEIDEVLAEIEAARGDPLRSLRIERERLPRLLASIEREMGRFADQAADIITERQREALEAAREYVQLTLEPVAGLRMGRVYAAAVEQMVGFASDGSPLRELLDALGPEASEAVRRELIQGVILGRGPRETAAAIQKAMGMGLTRALRIARTETMRAYREATRQHYLANSDIVKGWIWWSARDARTCIACIAMHGTEHKLAEVLDDHVNGRCTMIAVVHGERGRLTPSVETGEAWFEGLDAEAQRKHMPSEAAYQAYKYGEVTLRDFVGRRESTRWGSMRYARSLTEMAGAERAKWWAGVARREKGFSQHPVDWAVRRAIFRGDVLSDEAWEAALEYLRGVAFNPRHADVTPSLVGDEYLGHVLREREPSLLAHLAKRVLSDGQWQEGTTAEEYLGDLRRVVDAWEGAALYKRRGNIVFLFGATENVVPAHRLGPNAGAYTAMVYSADRGKILSGYQFRSLDEVNVPETALWLWRKING